MPVKLVSSDVRVKTNTNIYQKTTTSSYNIARKAVADPLIPSVSPFIYLRRHLPLFNIRSPELRTLSARLDSLVPSPLLGNAKISGDEEL